MIIILLLKRRKTPLFITNYYSDNIPINTVSINFELFHWIFRQHFFKIVYVYLCNISRIWIQIKKNYHVATEDLILLWEVLYVGLEWWRNSNPCPVKDVVVASSLTLSLFWGWTRSLLRTEVRVGQGIHRYNEVKYVQIVGSGFSKLLKSRFWKSAGNEKTSEFRYFFFRNAYVHRGIWLILGKSEE